MVATTGVPIVGLVYICIGTRARTHALLFFQVRVSPKAQQVNPAHNITQPISKPQKRAYIGKLGLNDVGSFKKVSLVVVVYGRVWSSFLVC